MTRRPVPVPVTALLDGDGRLLRAEEPLLRLQAEAGGQPHGPLAPPALATLVRLALRLRVPLSRAVELAREDTDISLWVQIHPRHGGLQLTVTDWQERHSRAALARMATLRAGGLEAEPGWSWQVDAHMRFAPIEADAARLGHEPPQSGSAFTAYFALEDEDARSEQGMPIIAALAERADFADQAARLRADPDIHYRISGTAMFDRTGAFLGYQGRAIRGGSGHGSGARQPVPAAPEAPQAPVARKPEAGASDLFGPALGHRLDQALRQPLDRIIANAATIGDRIEGPLRQDYVNYASDISAAGRHLLGLVDDLADLHAIERPGFRPTGEEVDLAEIARRAAGLLNVRAEARQVRIQAPAADEHVHALAEYRRVLQILVNLIGNAVRHSPMESTIWVRVDEEDGRAKVIVADQGSGIDPADHGRIFERFERLGNKDGEGSGLGLYISRRLARAMGGDVTLESALGRGARFTLDLPLWEASRAGSKVG